MMYTEENSIEAPNYDAFNEMKLGSYDNFFEIEY